MQDEPQPPSSPPVTLEDIDTAPTEIDPSAQDVRVTAVDYAREFARVTEEKTALQIENERLKMAKATADLLDKLIEPFANKTFIFMCCYCGSVGALLLLHGFHVRGFALPESAIGFLVGSTAVTVIGLVGMVLTGIFVGARK